MKAKAVVFTSKNVVEFREVTCPDPAPDDAVVQVTHSWISNGTEGSYLRGERINGDTPYRPGDPIPFPIVTGYQKVAVVEKVGAAITDLTPGETVFCSVGKVDGMFFPVGGHVSPSVSPRETIWKLPQDADPLAFSPLLLAQVGYNCGSRAPIEKDQWALVIGDGAVGQWAAQTLVSRGARVIMAGIDEHRLELARTLTPCESVNVKTTDWLKTVQKLAPDGIAMAVDVVGSKEMTEAAVTLLNHDGNIVSAGFCSGDDRVSLQALRDKELTLYSVSGANRPRMDQTRNLITQGTLRTLPLITHHFPAEQAAQAWQVINERREPVLGVVLDWR